MNQPTREEFDDLKEEVRKLKQQQTEPMKVTRIEVASEDVLKRLDRIDQKQDEYAKALASHSRSVSTLQEDVASLKSDVSTIKNDVGTLKDDMKGVKADIISITASQSDMRDRVVELKEAMATKKDLEAMATKKDLEAMETRIIETVKQLLQQKPGE